MTISHDMHPTGVDTDPDFAAACREERESLETSIRYAQDRVEQLRAKLVDVEARLRPKYELLAALKAAGFEPHLSTYTGTVTLETTQDKLTDVYRVTGRLKKEYSNLADPRKKLVEVTLTGVKHDFLQVRYTRKLKPTDPCRVVKSRVKAKTEYSLECRVPTAQVTT
jgi:hypothetical protein